FYRQFVQPWVRAMVSPVNADLVQKFHPMRIQYEWWSDRHPLAPLVAKQADAIRAERRPVAPDNPLLQWQQTFSQAMVTALDTWRDVRDHAYEQTFKAVYGAPWIQAFAYDSEADARTPAPTSCDSPEHAAFVEETLDDLR